MSRPPVPAEPTGVVDLFALAQTSSDRLVWFRESADLDINLVRLEAGDGIGEHVNAEVDVLVLGVSGEGVVTIGDREHAVRAGQLLIVPKDERRSTRAVGGPFAYLTCHRRRAGLWPR
jgi:quercetin dioxygenase-like cupin family protein